VLTERAFPIGACHYVPFDAWSIDLLFSIFTLSLN
jgi:hypothetical protein